MHFLNRRHLVRQAMVFQGNFFGARAVEGNGQIVLW